MDVDSKYAQIPEGRIHSEQTFNTQSLSNTSLLGEQAAKPCGPRSRPTIETGSQQPATT